MGVRGLWRLLDGFGEVMKPEALRGQRVAVDASVWISQFRSAGRGRGTRSERVLSGFFQRILWLLHYDIKPVFVFDGPSSSLKATEHQRRRTAGAEQKKKFLVRRAREILAAQQASKGQLGLKLMRSTRKRSSCEEGVRCTSPPLSDSGDNYPARTSRRNHRSQSIRLGEEEGENGKEGRSPKKRVVKDDEGKSQCFVEEWNGELGGGVEGVLKRDVTCLSGSVSSFCPRFCVQKAVTSECILRKKVASEKRARNEEESAGKGGSELCLYCGGSCVNRGNGLMNATIQEHQAMGDEEIFFPKCVKIDMEVWDSNPIQKERWEDKSILGETKTTILGKRGRWTEKDSNEGVIESVHMCSTESSRNGSKRSRLDSASSLTAQISAESTVKFLMEAESMVRTKHLGERTVLNNALRFTSSTLFMGPRVVLEGGPINEEGVNRTMPLGECTAVVSSGVLRSDGGCGSSAYEHGHVRSDSNHASSFKTIMFSGSRSVDAVLNAQSVPLKVGGTASLWSECCDSDTTRMKDSEVVRPSADSSVCSSDSECLQVMGLTEKSDVKCHKEPSKRHWAVPPLSPRSPSVCCADCTSIDATEHESAVTKEKQEEKLSALTWRKSGWGSRESWVEEMVSVSSRSECSVHSSTSRSSESCCSFSYDACNGVKDDINKGTAVWCFSTKEVGKENDWLDEVEEEEEEEEERSDESLIHAPTDGKWMKRRKSTKKYQGRLSTGTEESSRSALSAVSHDKETAFFSRGSSCSSGSEESASCDLEGDSLGALIRCSRRHSISSSHLSCTPPAPSGGSADRNEQSHLLPPPAQRVEREEIPFELVDIVELLRCFGLPFVLSSSEADIECARLSVVGEVDAVFTEDSDVVVHGARVVWRGFFSKTKHVVQYRQDDLTACGISKAVLVSLAVLLGCDYHDGVHGVGLNNALNILCASYKVDSPEWSDAVNFMNVSELVEAWLSRWKKLVDEPLPSSWVDGDEHMSPLQYSLLCDNHASWRKLALQSHFPSREVVNAFCVTDKVLPTSSLFSSDLHIELEWCVPEWERVRQYAAARGIFTVHPYLEAQMERVQETWEKKREQEIHKELVESMGSRTRLLTDVMDIVVTDTKSLERWKYKRLPPSLRVTLELLHLVQEKQLASKRTPFELTKL